MGNIICLDVGDVRVGVAIGTSEPPSCRPHKTFIRAAGRAERDILKLIEELKPELMVVGRPLNDNDSANEQCSKIEKFCKRLQKRINIKIYFIDEYASSEEAKELIGSSGRRKVKGSRGDIDSMAACIILKRYLDALE